MNDGKRETKLTHISGVFLLLSVALFLIFYVLLFVHFTGEYDFYVNHKHLEYLERMLERGICFDKDYNKLDTQTIYPFYKYYNDGFLKGYNEFENSLKNNTSLFNITNEQIAFKIFSRVIRNGIIKENDGNFKLVNDAFSNKEIDKKICDEHGIKFTIKIYKENFFKSGFNGGEFYKAWEIILNNPTVFEPIFLKNNKNEKELIEPEAIDLIDTNTTEKIKKNEDKNWFKVGLLFATGEINDLLKKFENNASAIARHKGNKSFRPHITESLGASKETSSQSVYYPDNFKIIYNHCKENDIKITPEFKAYYSKIELSLN